MLVRGASVQPMFRSAWNQQSAWRSPTELPGVVAQDHGSGNASHRGSSPAGAPSVAILTGSGETVIPAMPRPRDGPASRRRRRRPPLVAGEKVDHPSRQVPLPHVVERGVVYGAIFLSTRRDAAGSRGGSSSRSTGNARRNRCRSPCQYPPGLVAGAGVVDVHAAVSRPARSTSCCSPAMPPASAFRKRPTWRSETSRPRVQHLRDPSRRRLALVPYTRWIGQGLDAGAVLLAVQPPPPASSGATCRLPSGNSQTSRR